jgi:DNA-directed RNA polymerase specialized sigma24 family protein
MSDSAGSVCIEDAVVAKLDLKKVMSDLHPKDRELFMLHFMTGRSWVEIAEMTGQSKHALKRRGARMVENLGANLALVSIRSRITETRAAPSFTKDAQCL